MLDKERKDLRESEKQKWLIVSGCQTLGLGQSLALICPDVAVETCDIWTFKRYPAAIRDKLEGFSRIIVSTEVADLGLIDFRCMPNVSLVPHLVFGGYHPDLCYVLDERGAVVSSPIGDYNSLIAVSAYKVGMNELQALKLYTQSTYEEIGYFSVWQSERRALLGDFAAVGIDISTDFYRWVRNGCFMYSLNHPKIGALYDLAARFAGTVLNKRILESDIRPPDGLAVGAIYPLFPEIADRYCCGNGSYQFRAGELSVCLEEFIAGSFAKYREYAPDCLSIKTNTYDSARAMIVLRR